MEIAKKYHLGQKDKGGNDYYSGHLYRIAMMVSPFGKPFEETAWLHDILEDTDCNEEILISEGIDKNVIEAVKAMTKKKHEKYFDYLERVKENEISRIVKIFDILDNMNLSRLKEITEKDLKRNEKYQSALMFLIA